MRLRELTSHDTDLLRRTTLANMNWSDERFDLDELDALPEIAHYYHLGAEDFGLVVETDETEPVGAVWCQFADADNPGYGFVARSIPELSIGVTEQFRGQGLASLLLDSIIEEATERRCPGISLSVEAGNWAQQFYRRTGFRTVGINGNSDTMLLDLTNDSADSASGEPGALEDEALEGEALEGEVL